MRDRLHWQQLGVMTRGVVRCWHMQSFDGIQTMARLLSAYARSDPPWLLVIKSKRTDGCNLVLFLQSCAPSLLLVPGTVALLVVAILFLAPVAEHPLSSLQWAMCLSTHTVRDTERSVLPITVLMTPAATVPA